VSQAAPLSALTEYEIGLLIGKLTHGGLRQGECFVYPHVDRMGYGVVWLPRRTGHRGPYAAHRIAAKVVMGLKDSEQVLHHCDVRNCFEVRHLYKGTQQDNLRDAYRRGRHPQAKLSMAIAEAIRQDRIEGMSYRQLAAKYGVTDGNIWWVTSGQSWNYK
jgi:hypothetical protein